MLVEFGFRNVVIEWGFNKEGHKVMKFQRVISEEDQRPNNSPCIIEFYNDESLETVIKAFKKNLKGKKMYKTNDGYYHFEDDLRNYPDVWVYAVWSRRGPGKTYSALKWAYENKIPFIYMKRTDDDVDIITMRSDDASDFDPSPYAPINRDLGTNIKAIKLHKGFGAFYEFDSEGHPYGNAVSYIISFNQIKKYKGFALTSSSHNRGNCAERMKAKSYLNYI